MVMYLLGVEKVWVFVTGVDRYACSILVTVHIAVLEMYSYGESAENHPERLFLVALGFSSRKFKAST